MNMSNLHIQVLKAEYGDCIFISIKKEEREFNILVDGGLPETYENVRDRRHPAGPLKELVDELKQHSRLIDLVVITHIDDDHIGGVKKWFESDFPSNEFVKKVWMNGDIEVEDNVDLNNSVKNAVSVIRKLKDNNIFLNDEVIKGYFCKNEFCTIRILTPAKEYRNTIAKAIHESLDNVANTKVSDDKSFRELIQEEWKMENITPANKASIAFELEIWDGEKLLFLGDADYNDIMSGLVVFHKDKSEKLKYDMIKLSHHGSKNNFHPDFLERIYASYYIVSSNGKRFGHPDKEVLAHIICNSDSSIMFNYEDRMKEIITLQDYIDFPNLASRIKAID